MRKGIEKFLSHYPPFLRHLVFPGLCSLLMLAVIILIAIVGSCMNCAGTCTDMGKRLAHRESECSVGVNSASGYLGSTGGCCYWNVSVESEYIELCFDYEEVGSDFVVVIMSGDGGMVIGEYALKETKSVFLIGPAEYRVIIFAESGYGPWNAAWD